MKFSIRNVLALAVLAGMATASAGIEVPGPPESSDAPDATIAFSGGVVAVGAGYQWVRGTLSYRGQTYGFHVRGVSILDIGAAHISGAGQVFNLKTLQDFEGNYAGTSFGSAVPRGASLALVKNEHGVTIRARSVVSGVRLNFSGNGMHIKLDLPPSVQVPHSEVTS
ncbi:MAG TPA: hypothetical protein VGV09_14270 [Steroidobacteraceae bacterium]|nr:hypothetical protein [Steroidobacteraceae bacterium]